MCGRERPIFLASCSWWHRIIEELLIGRRLFQRVELLPVQVLDQRIAQQVSVGGLRTMAGISLRSARWLARQRRSPMMSS